METNAGVQDLSFHQLEAEVRGVSFNELEPELVLPEQFFDGLYRRAGRSPEHNLVVALLCDALYCFQKNAFAATGARRALFRDVETWFMERNTGAALEFEDVCAALGLDEDTIRKRLGRWREQGLGGLSEGAAAPFESVDNDLPPEPPYRRAVGGAAGRGSTRRNIGVVAYALGQQYGPRESKHARVTLEQGGCPP